MILGPVKRLLGKWAFEYALRKVKNMKKFNWRKILSFVGNGCLVVSGWGVITNDGIATGIGLAGKAILSFLGEFTAPAPK